MNQVEELKGIIRELPEKVIIKFIIEEAISNGLSGEGLVFFYNLVKKIKSDSQNIN